MKPSKFHVWHDAHGKIIAIGHPVAHQKPNHGVIPKCNHDQQVLEIEVEEKLVEHLHKTHVVDVKNGVLVTRSSRT